MKSLFALAGSKSPPPAHFPSLAGVGGGKEREEVGTEVNEGKRVPSV